MPETSLPQAVTAARNTLLAGLGARSIVLVGMMGAGKSSVGRKLAGRLSLPFVDADTEIEAAAGMSVSDIFEIRGEDEFRSGEARVIARLLEAGPQVLATGGGAVMNEETRAAIKAHGISIWLRADFDVLMNRIKRRNDRPLLRTADPAATLRALIDARYPVYAQADIVIDSRDVPHEVIVDEICAALEIHIANEKSQTGSGSDAGRAREADLVRVGLGARTYDIAIGRGVLESLGARVAHLRPGARCAILTDETVAGHHLAAAERSLAQAGIAHSHVAVPPGEGSKSYAMFETVCEKLIAARIERGDLLIALGGGVIGDLGGFVASVIRRGLDFVQVPTTLLAQVDSSVGGKTGINSRHGKNLIGAFHQPILVLADTALLDTLPARQMRAGYAEIAKYGLLGDAAFFAWLEANWQGIFEGSAAREYAVMASCRMKADIVARDERESGERALLNLGHTFGHALEAAAGFSSRLLHGEAIAIGMTLAFAFSAERGLLAAEDAARVARHLAAVGLPTRIADIPGDKPNIDMLMALIAQDKKVKRGALTFILARGIGKSFIASDVEAEDVRDFLAGKLAR